MVRQQQNQVMSTTAILTQLAVMSLFSKEAGGLFSTTLNKMTE